MDHGIFRLLVSFAVICGALCVTDEDQSGAKPKVSASTVNVALLVSPDARIDYTLLRTSLDMINHELRTKNSEVSLNIFKVVVKPHELFSDDILYAKNLTRASYLLEPFSVHPYTCHLADMLGIPHIVLTEAFDKGCRHSLSLRPSNDVLFEGAMAMLRQLKPRMIVVICETTLSEEAVRFMALDQFNKRLSFQLMATIDFHDHATIVDAVTEIRLSTTTFHVLLMVKCQNIPLILTEAKHQGLLWEDKWFTPWVGQSIAMQIRNISPYAGLKLPVDEEAVAQIELKLGGGVPSGLDGAIPRKIDPVMHDALRIIADSYESVLASAAEDKSAPRSSTPHINSHCPLRKVNEFGDTLYNTAKKVIYFGLSGRIQFSSEGYRSITELEFASVKEGNIRKRGLWSAPCKKITLDPNLESDLQQGRVACKHQENEVDNSFLSIKRHLIVATKNDPPLIFYDNTKYGNDRFTGFCKDLLDLLSKDLNFTYKMEIVQDGNFGNKKNGTWDGMIRDLITEKADVAVGSLTITSQRETAVDFTKPFLDFTMSLILKKPEEELVDIFTFLKPFKGELWLSVVGVIFCVACLIFALDYYSPTGFRQQAEKNGQDDGNDFSFANCVWFATGSMLQQGPDKTPRNFPARVMSAVFWFFILIIVSTYTANLAAFFTTGRVSTTITSLEDLAKQEDIHYGIYEGGQTYAFFQSADLSLYRKMWAQMNTRDTFAKTTDRAMKRVRAGGYAYLTEDPILSYANQRHPCNTYLVKNLLEAKSYGLALKSDSQWTNHLSVKILELREKGLVEELRLKWWDSRSECPATDPKLSINPSLELRSMAGVYVFLLAGVAICFACLFYEVRFPDGIDMLKGRKKRNSAFHPTATYRDIKKMDTVDSGIVKITDYRDGSTPRSLEKLNHIPTKQYFDAMNTYTN